MTDEELKDLEELRFHPAVLDLQEYITQYFSYQHNWLSEEEINELKEKQYKVFKQAVVHWLVDKAPDELGFILQAKTYEDYIKTFTDVGGTAEEAPYTVEEFKRLKDYYGTKE